MPIPSITRRNPWTWLLSLLLAAMLSGCAALHEKQGEWIFQPSTRDWGGGPGTVPDMADVWIAFQSERTGAPVRLHALWHAAYPDDAARTERAPVMLDLHGARWNVTGSAHRVRRMQELGFSVLALDYRGFGKSDNTHPSEDLAYEDALAAWKWLAANYPQRQRFIFGHSLGGAIAIHLAAQVSDEAGTIVEGTFTSIPDVAARQHEGAKTRSPLTSTTQARQLPSGRKPSL